MDGGEQEKKAAAGPKFSVPAPPTNVPTTPDKATKKAFTDGDAPQQVFHLSWKGLRYGTDDKGHAAALILSITILGVMIVALLIGMLVDRPWVGETLKILGSGFLIVAGIAVGKSVEKSKSDD